MVPLLRKSNNVDKDVVDRFEKFIPKAGDGKYEHIERFKISSCHSRKLRFQLSASAEALITGSFW